MADVFISYSDTERDLTLQLAETLTSTGYTVWWDTDLEPTESFSNQIDAQLDACTAAIIIWSATSAKSVWVRSEAEHARRQAKLINTYHTDISPESFPKPFDQISAVHVCDTPKIISAIEKLKTRSRATSHTLPNTTEDFVSAAVSDILRHTTTLREIANLEDWEEDRSYHGDLLHAAEKVSARLGLFRARLPYPEITDYRMSLSVRHLDQQTKIPHDEIQNEISWLRNYRESKSVLGEARRDLSHAAEQLMVAIATLPE